MKTVGKDEPGFQIPELNDWSTDMHILILIFLPFLVFFHLKKTTEAIICLLLQIMLIGWIPASIWAFIVVRKNEKDEGKPAEAVGTSEKKSPDKKSKKEQKSDEQI
ncbi:MAG: YqaE/Pmp3 family membrane protein [Sneathiella sp.]